MIASFAQWWFWVILGVLLVAQALLLVVPVRTVWDYEIKPRRLMVPLVTTCVLLALLVVGIFLSSIVVLTKDKFLSGTLLIGGLIFCLSWIVWWWVFRRYGRRSPDVIIDRTSRALIRGSIAELLVAVACHIWVRQRGDCSAPAFTFGAICAGIAIVLCALGPGVFCLFVARARGMQPRSRRTL